MHYFWGMGWGWIIGIVILFFMIWFVVKSVNQSTGSNQPGKSALDILKERNARWGDKQGRI